MEHKFVIEVRIRHEAPEVPEVPKHGPHPVVNVDPKVLNSLLAQLPHALAAMQPKPAPKETPKK